MYCIKKEYLFVVFMLTPPIAGMDVFLSNMTDGLIDIAQGIWFLRKLPDPYNIKAFRESILLGLNRQVNFSKLGVSSEYERYVKTFFFTSFFIKDECDTVIEIIKNAIKNDDRYLETNRILCKKLIFQVLTTGTVFLTDYLLFLTRSVVV